MSAYVYNVCMYVYVCMYAYVWVRMYVYACMYVFISVRRQEATVTTSKYYLGIRRERQKEITTFIRLADNPAWFEMVLLPNSSQGCYRYGSLNNNWIIERDFNDRTFENLTGLWWLSDVKPLGSMSGSWLNGLCLPNRKNFAQPGADWGK